MTRNAIYFLAPCAVLACSISGSVLEQGDTRLRADGRALAMQWPVEVGVATFVTQSPSESSQPYPCGSGVNARHILQEGQGVNLDYLQSLDIVVDRSGQAIAPSEGRGTDVVAVAAGRVVARNFEQTECDRPIGAGNYLIVEHAQVQRDGKPLRSAYMHLNSTEEAETKLSCGSNPHPTSLQNFRPPALGSLVQAGQKLGEIGNTGNSTGPHLHFQFATDCVLEPTSEVDCPAIAVLSVNAAGFANAETRGNHRCSKLQGVGNPGTLASPQEKSYLADGTIVTARARTPAIPPLALTLP